MIDMNYMTIWILLGFAVGVGLTVTAMHYRHHVHHYMHERAQRKGAEPQL